MKLLGLNAKAYLTTQLCARWLHTSTEQIQKPADHRNFDMTTNDDARRLMVTLMAAAVLGAWTFAGTRASSQDIAELQHEIEEVELEAKERHAELAATVEEIKNNIQSEAVEAAAFRAQVRSALEIRDRN